MEKKEIIRQIPTNAENKYNLAIDKIRKLKVLDWEALKTKTWLNTAMSKPCWCHLSGCQGADSKKYDDENEIWIGFYEDGRIRVSGTSYGGMCHYNFNSFYNPKTIKNKFDLNVQINFLRYINELIDTGILSKPE